MFIRKLRDYNHFASHYFAQKKIPCASNIRSLKVNTINLCKKEVKSLKQLFFTIHRIIISFLRNQNIRVAVTQLTILFDVFRDSKDNIQNHVIIIINIKEKFFIYQCKLNSKEPTLKVFNV